MCPSSAVSHCIARPTAVLCRDCSSHFTHYDSASNRFHTAHTTCVQLYTPCRATPSPYHWLLAHKIAWHQHRPPFLPSFLPCPPAPPLLLSSWSPTTTIFLTSYRLRHSLNLSFLRLLLHPLPLVLILLSLSPLPPPLLPNVAPSSTSPSQSSASSHSSSSCPCRA